MSVLACVDTNVLISMFITSRENSPVVKIFEEIVKGNIVPLASEEILSEYRAVSARPKFHIPEDARAKVLDLLARKAVIIEPGRSYAEELREKLGDSFDPGDAPFYAVVMEKRGDDSYLITGNLKHFPSEPYIVTPREMLNILGNV